MASVNIARGGTPDFKGWFERGDYAEFTPPFGLPPMPSTPPYNSHADAAHGQGFLNLQFPLIPRIEDTTAHAWMWSALKKHAAVGARIYTNWVPLRSIVTDLHWEVTRVDKELEGVYVRPCAARVVYNFDTKEWEYNDNTDYTAMLTTNSVGQFPLGTVQEGDTLWAIAHNSTPLCTFGHDIPKFGSDGAPTEGYDDYFGAVMLGYEIAEGAPEKIAEIWHGNFAIYFSGKLHAFECGIQV